MTPTPTPARVIVVEDNEFLLEEMLFQLNMQGFAARGAPDAAALDALLALAPCDILVLDLNLPGEDGFSIARRLCDRQRLGIVMLTARDDIEDKLRGFADGADLYLVKPVDRRELAACIRALHRRLVPAAGTDSGWRLQAAQRKLLAPGGQALDLTPQDVQVLALLAEQPGGTCARQALVRALGIDFVNAPEGRINTTVSRLRQKLAAFDAELRIITWRNQGYSYIGPPLALA